MELLHTWSPLQGVNTKATRNKLFFFALITLLNDLLFFSQKLCSVTAIGVDTQTHTRARPRTIYN